MFLCTYILSHLSYKFHEINTVSVTSYAMCMSMQKTSWHLEDVVHHCTSLYVNKTVMTHEYMDNNI